MKARKMWASVDGTHVQIHRTRLGAQRYLHPFPVVIRPKKDHVIPVAVLPIGDPEALVEQVANVILSDLNREHFMEPCRQQARAVLESLGILPKKRKAKS